ncbi:MFS transporter [Oenococcus kitaharae]|uniref:MDR-type permease n=1 Tax=Oenococcus kitaharae DSM 17330 TaxID=1045004 RepID=G9WGH5_9LACO|nr:MDR-type permease [Oenococcus kitaharae DSM 17330]
MAEQSMTSSNKQDSAVQNRHLNKSEWSWILYDWANSSFGIIVVTAVLPIFLMSVGQNSGYSQASSAAFWSYANSFSTLLVAFSAPFLGALADFAGMKRKLFSSFTIIGIAATAALVLAGDRHFWLLLGIFVIANIGYSAGNIFYDSYLIDVTSNDRMDKVSSAGYGWGYMGGLVPFSVFYGMVVSGILKGNRAYYAAFLIAAIWWLVWTLPFWRNVKQRSSLPLPQHALRSAIAEISGTIKHFKEKEYRQLAIFLLAYFFYIDGVNTIFTVASPFGLAVGIQASQLLIVLLVVQLLAFPFSILYGYLGKRVGTKRMLIVGVCVYLLIVCYALFINSALEFWILAVLVGTSQGGIQALSRSYFGKLLPKEHASEFFGFFNIFGKFSAIIGPFLFGVAAQLSGHVQIGAFSMVILFLLGLILLVAVKENSEKA